MSDSPEIAYQARFCLHISYPAILLTMLKGFLNQVYHSRPSAGNKQSVHIVFLTRPFPSDRAHVWPIYGMYVRCLVHINLLVN